METQAPWKYLDQHAGQVFKYKSTLRSVASIGIDRIPAYLLEPGCDPDGTRREFATYQPLPASFLNRMDIDFLGVAFQEA